MSDDANHHEIVIIRRGSRDELHEHHGGVWKIAFADFMTAMMAFFLVMWLVSANNKTRASVARYFNPIRLVDATTQPKGLHEAKSDESGITARPSTRRPENDKAEAGKADAGKAEVEGEDKAAAKGENSTGKPAGSTASGSIASGSETAAQRDQRLDTTLRDNPMVALAEIAGSKGLGDKTSPSIHTSTPAVGRRGGEAFRDPFAPPPPPPPGAISDDEDPADAGAVKGTKRASAGDADKGDADKPFGDAKGGDGKAAIATDPNLKAADPKTRGDAEAKAVADALKPAIADGRGPKLDVRRTSEGLVVSLTDTSDFTMFPNGSAVPAKRVVNLMESVAKVIRAKSGLVIVRGYTDNKPYKSGRYDNWHLSLDRAQVTHYMLVRGGLDDGRIGHVEGYADRAAKHGTDASSPLNRRIEILVKEPG